MATTVKNCHFISRSHTEAWEQGAERNLLYYDFTTRKIAEQSSRTLFAVKGLHNVETEERLSKLMETPVGRFVKGMQAGIKPETAWTAFRAVGLRLLLQSARTSAAAGNDAHEQALSRVASLSEADLTGLVIRALSGHEPRLVRADNGEHLMFPDNGLVLIPVHDPEAPDNLNVAYGVPIDPKTLLIAIAPSARIRRRSESQSSIPTMMTMVSTGLVANRVLIPRELLLLHTQDELCQLIPRWRAETQSSIDLVSSRAEQIRGFADLTRLLASQAG
jgi:hypothetical protein